MEVKVCMIGSKWVKTMISMVKILRVLIPERRFDDQVLGEIVLNINVQFKVLFIIIFTYLL